MTTHLCNNVERLNDLKKSVFIHDHCTSLVVDKLDTVYNLYFTRTDEKHLQGEVVMVSAFCA